MTTVLVSVWGFVVLASWVPIARAIRRASKPGNRDVADLTMYAVYAMLIALCWPVTFPIGVVTFTLWVDNERDKAEHEKVG